MGQELTNKPHKSTGTPTHHPSRRQSSQRNDDQLWKNKDYRVESNVPRVMSVLVMFKTNHSEYHNNSKAGAAAAVQPLPPADWVSYIKQEEEEERLA